MYYILNPHQKGKMQLLIEKLQIHDVIRSPEVCDALRKTDRANYLPDHRFAYEDTPFPIGYNQTIQAPHTHGYALEIAYVTVRDISRPHILDVGAGSGFLTACFGRLIEHQNGRVFGLESIHALVQVSICNICKDDRDLLDKKIVSMCYGDGYDGFPVEAPFHFIYIGDAVDVPPKSLMEQLSDGGRMVLPLTEPRGGQTPVEITRHRHSFSQRNLMSVCSVPIVRY
uniref:protein-L-isoaspartate(D-aspartate) O-methyltransferase n=1 Tax=Albugo laibachii Nc14 TaxID=890382 RepID=F0WK90_9STRA|nr:proteinLisoaspartate Omethyltransferase putative [Albugo laibachii Nc14]|eukprot:CCA21693.1 proteinLisoaspartate Omethyltransferase putative [Albugo laibachii Nc14]